MKILGIDPGLQVCGYACVQIDAEAEKLIEAGIFQTDSDLAIEARLNQIAQDIKALLENFSPDVVAVEQLYSHYKHPTTAILMGHARGVILQSCAAAGIKVKSFNPTRIKKSLTGSGRASKPQMQRAIQTRLYLRKQPEPSDVADAVAVALCCANTLNSILVTND